MTTPDWMPPLPDADYLLAIPDQPYDRGYTTTSDGYSDDQMHDYALAAVESYKRSLKPVAWGVPNSRITERQPFLSLLHQLPVEGGVDGRRKTPLYEAMMVPLYRLDGGDDA